jgi:hypothetical protein
VRDGASAGSGNRNAIGEAYAGRLRTMSVCSAELRLSHVSTAVTTRR